MNRGRGRRDNAHNGRGIPDDLEAVIGAVTPKIELVQPVDECIWHIPDDESGFLILGGDWG